MLYFAHLCNTRASIGMCMCLQRAEGSCSDIPRNAFYLPWERASPRPRSHQLARWTGRQASGMLQSLPSNPWNDRCLKCGSPCLAFWQGFWGWSSGLHVCEAGILPPEYLLNHWEKKRLPVENKQNYTWCGGIWMRLGISNSDRELHLK